ncbi:MAG: O-antigen polymerase [Kordia sp.]|uniref:O-antigen polymerase n=1 Tax=Kordia sp. TaxID=1965332 RepID=UPI00385F5C1D
MIILLAILLIFVLGFTAYFIIQRGVGAIYSNPLVLATLFFAIIHLLLPLMQINADYYRYQEEYSTITILISIILVVVGQLIYMVFFSRFKLDYYQVFKDVKGRNRELNRIININILIFLVGAYFAYNNLSGILSIGVTEYLRDRISHGQGKGIQILFAHWTYLSAFIFIFCYFLSTKKKIKRKALFFTIISTALSITYYTLNSNRNSIFTMLLIIGGAWIINNRMLNTKLSKKQAKIIGSIFLALIFAFTLFFNIGKERYALYASRHKEFEYSLVKSLNGAFGNHENILWLLENKHEKLWGQTYVAGFTNPIPRSLWPNKPLGAGPKLKNMIDPGSYVIGGERNSSLTTGYFTELQMNYGVVGMIIFPVAIAIFVGFLLRRLNRSKYIIVRITSFFTAIMFATMFYYAEFLGFYSRFFISLIPFLLIYFLTSIRLKLKKTNTKLNTISS